MAQNTRERLHYLWRQITLPKPLLTTPDIPDHVEELHTQNAGGF